MNLVYFPETIFVRMGDDGDRGLGLQLFLNPVQDEFGLRIIPGRVNQQNFRPELYDAPIGGNQPKVREIFIRDMPPDVIIYFFYEDIIR